MEKLNAEQLELFQYGGSLDDYEILRPIGKGKFSIVYRAQRKRDGLLVALKKISIDVMDNRSREKTLKEVRVALCLI
jgi:serine/threonine protein kinase